MANVIRQDVVQIGFETNLAELKKINKLVDDLKESMTGNRGKDALDDLQEGAQKAKKPIDKLKESAGKLNDKLTDVGKKGSVAAFNGLKKVAGVSFKALAVTATAAATAVGAIVTQSAKAYANYEQLVGGVETLFGAKGAKSVEEYAEIVGKPVSKVKDEYNKLIGVQDDVMKNAKGAWKSSGMSTNAYLETVTGFSASLIQSVGGDTKKAAELADMAIIDMSDNANKMGTDIESIKYAYQGFAKQNYTMLDNLKLGYGGTKEEMARLVKDAAKIDKSVDANSMSYANIVKAVHAVQESLYITGTTQKEAEKTVTGSLNAMKASYQNLLTAIGSGEGVDEAIDNMVSSALTFADNLAPVLERALGGLGTVIEKLTPVIADKLPQLAEDLLPPLITATIELTKGLIKALPEIVKAVGDAIVGALGDQFPAIKKIGTFLSDNADSIAEAIKKVIPVVLALVAAFKLFKAGKGIASVFGGGKGGKGGEGGGGFLGKLSELAKMKTTDVLKGMANLAIIIGGFVAIAAVLMLVAPLITQLGGMGAFLQLTLMIGALGVVGVALTKFGEIAGKVPVATVAKGLANMAIMIGGMTALLLVIGAVSMMNFDLGAIMQLVLVLGALGIVGAALTLLGAIVGLIPVAVVALGLANMAIVIGGMTALVLLLGATSLMNFDIGRTMELVKLIGAIGTIGAALSVFAGVVGLIPIPLVLLGIANMALVLTGVAALGKKLTDFANNTSGFFTKVASFPQKGFENAKALFNCLAGLKSLPKDGGLAGWFKGNIDYAKIASGLEQMSSAGAVRFFTMVNGFSAQTFENTTALFKSLAGIGDLPSSGGVKGFFSGSVSLGDVAKDLGKFAKTAGPFFAQVNALNLNNLNGLWASLMNAEKLTANISKAIDKHIDDIVNKVSDLPNKMGEGLKQSDESLSTALVDVWKDAVKSSTTPVNKLLEGANWILKQFGSKKRVVSWQPYARGTDGHKGGNALVNDGRGAELVQMPNGDAFIPRGKNVLIPNAPKGMKVLPADRTAQLMGRNSSTFRYANGIGNIDIWDYMDNSSGLVSKISGEISYDGMSQFSTNVGKGMVSTISSEMSPWAKKLFDKEGAKGIGDYVPSKGVGQWRSTVARALKMEGQYSAANVARTLYQMQTESGGNPKAINLWDSNAKKGTPSKGLMQVIDPTFKAYARSGFSSNIYDPLSNILASVRYAVSRYGSLAKAYRGVGYANGGIATKPSIFGEAGAEMAIPLSQSKRQRGLSLWAKTGEMLGVSYSPEKDAASYSTTSYEENTYAPVFNLTISGTNDDRTMARKVKRWVAESVDDMFTGMANKSKVVREA